MPRNLVLIADDEPTILESLRELFEKNGYRTETATNGITAWDILVSLAAPHDLVAVVVDLQMPPGSFGGRDLVAKIRRAYSTQIPIAVFSGRGTISLSHEVTKAGANAFIEKEQGALALLDAVSRLIADAVHAEPVSRASPVRALAQHGDLPRLTVIALQDIERLMREALLIGFSPAQLREELCKTRHHLPAHVDEKLASAATFAKDARLSFGDVFDIAISISTAQLRRAPSPKQLRALKEMLVPIRNDLSHGREVSARALLAALLAAQDGAEQITAAQ